MMQSSRSLIPSPRRAPSATHPDARDARPRPPLIDREAEQEVLRDLITNARAGMGGALVLRGDSGVGKSALLEQAIGSASDLHVLRVVAVESETALGFAALHQLVRPLLPALDRLPEPQRRALGICFGLVSGPPADRFLIGLAVLTLLADAATSRPVLCVVDDAQWLDEESADVLGFVSRRLLADGVAVLFAVRETEEGDSWMTGLPELRIAGLSARHAGLLLDVLTRSVVDTVDG